jgi:multidrug resistance efflux pump
MMKAIFRVIATVLVVAAGSAGAYELWDYYMLSPWTRDAKVRADVVTIAPDVAGFVTDLRVKDNQFVHKGDILFVVDQARYKLALATAEANLAAGKASMLLAQGDARRRAKLTSLSITDEDKENSQHQADSATAAYGQAVADLDMARLNLERTTVRASVNGYITNLTLVVGQYAAVGTQLMALIDSDSYRVEGYFEETKMPAIKAGAHVAIYLMSGTPALQGHVESISRGITDSENPSGPELLANANPTFEWVRLAQRIPVRVHIDTVPDGVLISSGMTCTVVATEPARSSAIVSLINDIFVRQARATESHD